MDLRRIGSLCLLLALHGLATPASAQLWAGQSSALGYLPLSNGTMSVISGTVNGGFTAEISGPNGPERMNFKSGAGWYPENAPVPANSSTAPKLKINSRKFWKAAAMYGAAFAGPLLDIAELILADASLGNGETCANMGAAQAACIETGTEACTLLENNGRYFISTGTCFSQHNAFQFPPPDNAPFWSIWTTSQPGYTSEITGIPLEYYPEYQGKPYVKMYAHPFPDPANPPPSKTECITGSTYSCPDPDIAEEDQEPAIEKILPPSDLPAEWQVPEPKRPLPDIFEPVPLPPEWTNRPPAEMNPNGLPEPDYFAKPEKIPTKRPNWKPVVSPSTNPDPSQTPVEVTVNIPDEMKVEVQNWPSLVPGSIDSEPPIPESEWTLPSLDWGGGFLPKACPAPLTASLYGGEIEIPFDPVCSLAIQISGVIIALSLMVGVRYAWSSFG